MPIYEYRCQDCGHYVDVLQKLSDDPLKTCPECEADSLKRLISAPAFRLKGGGWYETDFKSEKEKRRNLAESSEGAAKDSGKSANGESKPAEAGAKGEGGSKSGEGSSSSSSSSGDTKGASSGTSAKGSGNSESKAAV